VAETPEFDKSKKPNDEAPAPGVELMRTHGRNVALATGARLVETVSGNLIKSFGLTYVTLQLKLPNEIALTGLTITAFVGVLVTPLYGSLGDRFGQDRVYLIGSGLVAVMVFPFFALLDMRTSIATWLAFVIAYNLGPTLLLSVQPSLFTRMFAPGVRYTGMSLAYQVSAIAGGFTPLCALWLLRQSGGSPWLVAAFLVVVALVSFGCVAAATMTVSGQRVLAR
jgi:MFS family permease